IFLKLRPGVLTSFLVRSVQTLIPVAWIWVCHTDGKQAAASLCASACACVAPSACASGCATLSCVSASACVSAALCVVLSAAGGCAPSVCPPLCVPVFPHPALIVSKAAVNIREMILFLINYL